METHAKQSALGSQSRIRACAQTLVRTAGPHPNTALPTTTAFSVLLPDVAESVWQRPNRCRAISFAGSLARSISLHVFALITRARSLHVLRPAYRVSPAPTGT